MEYYWVVEDEYQQNKMYWRIDNSTYITIQDRNGTLPIDTVVGCFKEAIIPILLHHLSHTVLDFTATNDHLPDVPKKLIVFRVDNGLSTVGPVWASAATPQEFMADVNSDGVIAIGN